MCDSSSWAMTLLYGTIKLYMGKGKFKSVSKKDCIKKPAKEIIDLLDRYGEDYKLLQYSKQWKNSGRGDSIIERLTTKSYPLFQYDIHKNFNTKYFLALSSEMQIRLLYQGFKFWKDKGIIKL
jgi:hypothetical protein